MARSDPANLQAQKDYAWASTMLGQRLARDGDIEEAFVLLCRAARTLEPVGAANPADINSRSNVALVSEGFGYAHARRGSDHALARAARKNHWQEARARFREAYAFWTEMRDKGVTTGADLARPKALALEIARCDAALTNAP